MHGALLRAWVCATCQLRGTEGCLEVTMAGLSALLSAKGW